MLIQLKDGDNFDEIVNKYKDQDKVVVVDFFALWCGPCKMITPKLKKLAEDLEGRIVLLTVDVDECEEVAQGCGIQAMPTFHIYKPGVEDPTTIVGADFGKLEGAVKQALGS